MKIADLIFMGGLAATIYGIINMKPYQLRMKYAPLFRETERLNKLPDGLLERVAEQESHFRPEIINGNVKSIAGAIGIMQIIPRFHPDVNPYQPEESIIYAGDYLKRLYKRFGDWEQALAAYNWGPTNLDNYGMNELPIETQDYIEEIGADVDLS